MTNEVNAEPDSLTWQTWVFEEYKLLSEHYFHENQAFRDLFILYGTLNSGLLAFIGSTLFQHGSHIEKLLPVVGIFLCVSWVVTLVRQREWRDYINDRMIELEEYVQLNWPHEEFQPLDIAIKTKWHSRKSNWPFPFNYLYEAIQEIPASINMMLVPVVFLACWIFILVLNVRI
ncbi:MAG: hypothetical protein HOC70_17025 [Gammaproteobacteria bacterium]|jgi:hypothetical protein|nr:hypothetical protein [Gammaproteobacteria bacterium]MBT4494948.1 hypothetical protein [Gammaproteobacteria bacterium]